MNWPSSTWTARNLRWTFCYFSHSLAFGSFGLSQLLFTRLIHLEGDMLILKSRQNILFRLLQRKATLADAQSRCWCGLKIFFSWVDGLVLFLFKAGFLGGLWSQLSALSNKCLPFPVWCVLGWHTTKCDFLASCRMSSGITHLCYAKQFPSLVAFRTLS